MTGREPRHGGDRTRARDGTELFTRRWPADAPDAFLLVVHGLGDHSGRYGELGRVLADQGVSVTAFDLRGHGRSPGKRGDAPSAEVLLSDIQALAEAVREDSGERDTPWFLLGHSMGGLLSLLYAVEDRPPAPLGVLASAPWLATRTEVPAWKELSGRLLARLAPGVTLSTGLDPENLSRDPGWRRAYEEDPLVHDRISARLYRDTKEAQDRVRRATLKLPALFLVPEDDPLVDPGASRELAARWAADLRTFPGFRHEPHGELGRERFFQAVAEWILSRAREGRSQNPGQARG